MIIQKKKKKTKLGILEGMPNLCKQDRLDAWAAFGLPLHSFHFQKIKNFMFLKEIRHPRQEIP